MPSSEEILINLRMIANDWRLLSVLWHVYFAFLILGLVFGARPTKRIAGVLLALPVLSVSMLAWLHANPFNGAFFALTGIILIVIAVRFSPGVVKVAPSWLTGLGALMITFGWIYPHFLDNLTPLKYLYAAPTGLVPCPTLSIIIGFTLILGGLGSRSWCLVLTTVGSFYGVFGAVRLGVKIDWVLLLGALGTAYAAFSPRLPESELETTAR